MNSYSSDYHPRDHTEDIMMGCLLAVTKSTYENGATLIIPGSHKWSPERIPKKEEAVPAELDVGDVLIFTGNVYHGGGANKSMYTHVHLKPLLFEKDN
jgi:ectoine hydroxylase-related dioxygenase (phytanoyl-CoA dioxygenase family)